MDVSPDSPLRLTFYRLLALPSGDARSLIALCPRDVLSTRSAEEAGHYLRARLAHFFPCGLVWPRMREGKTCVFFHVAGPCRPVPFETQSLLGMSGSAHVVLRDGSNSS